MDGMTGELPLTVEELVVRWKEGVKPQTLANWRNQGKGPRYIKVGRTILYPISEIEKYEKLNFHSATNVLVKNPD